jgi:hypothetical protein
MNSEPTPSDVSSAAVRCASCGAVWKAGNTNCWLCGAAMPSAASGGTTGRLSPAFQPRAIPAGKVSFSISTLLLATTLAAIVAALVAEVPGLGIPVCILLAPVLVRTVMVVRRREAAGKRVSTAEKVALLLTSFAVANVILAVVGVAAVGSFCAVCLGSAATLRGNSPFIVAAMAALTVTVGMLALMFKWVRARYRRDIR